MLSLLHPNNVWELEGGGMCARMLRWGKSDRTVSFQIDKTLKHLCRLLGYSPAVPMSSDVRLIV